MKTCKRCLLKENIFVKIKEDGVCEICHKDIPDTPLLIDFDRKVNEIKKKTSGRYHCLVMCSGGKDSVSALMLICRKYGLNPLVFTFDHGFENRQAVSNVEKACKFLGCDYEIIRYHDLREVFSVILNEKIKVSPCGICSMWYMIRSYEKAREFGIKYIVAGWTKGQISGKSDIEYMEMSQDIRDFIKNRMRSISGFERFPDSMKKINRIYGKGIEVISPHWFNSNITDSEKIDIIKKTGWEKIDSYPENSTNCEFNFISAYLQLRYYGYTHYTIEMSKLVRQDVMSRKEAEGRLVWKKKPEELCNILERNGMYVEKDWYNIG